jgi:energy-coupling factor transporter ATP-binding protein EcfA2
MIKNRNLTITKLQGYSGIHLKDNRPLVFKPGINLLVGRNGSGKSNLISLVQQIVTNRGDLKERIESSCFAKHLQKCLKKTRTNIESRFGEVKIAEYKLGGKAGSIRMCLTNIPNDSVVKNLLRPGEKFDGHIEIKVDRLPLKFLPIHGSQSTVKFEMNGYINTNVLSNEHDNKAHKIMEGPIRSVSDFVRGRILEFYQSEAFVSKMKQLELSINEKFLKFFGVTKKKVKINSHDLSVSGRISLSLMDGKNYIESAYLSMGETTLLNLVFSLTLAREEAYDILTMDEPDIHMHDDMVQVLVDELSELSRLLPKTIIIVASHSTAMIERLAALDKKQLNVITFDNDRNVSNDNGDIELINALSRNGVKFSPLMLSKRSNIFIENQLSGGREQRDFFLKFFSKDNLPNVIPIGSSGNVQDTSSFTSVFEEILNVSNVRSIGIQDGDIWFKENLKNYLIGKHSILFFTNLLSGNHGTYIAAKTGHNLFYFNFWEIENLYMMPDLLQFWRDKRRKPLELGGYKNFLSKNSKVISDEYLKTFYKSLVRIRVDRNLPVNNMRTTLSNKFEEIQAIITDELPQKVDTLIHEFLNKDLLNWFPGKEIKKRLEKEGYSFECSAQDFEGLMISKHLRIILTSPKRPSSTR